MSAVLTPSRTLVTRRPAASSYMPLRSKIRASAERASIFCSGVPCRPSPIQYWAASSSSANGGVRVVTVEHPCPYGYPRLVVVMAQSLAAEDHEEAQSQDDISR